VLGVVAGLLALYLVPVFLTGARLPFGSDSAYYVWMTRLAAHSELAVSGFRAGSHALLFDVSSVSGVDLLRSIGPLDVALEVALGLAAGALVCATMGFTRARFIVVGIVTSAYAARMATGYLGNLLFMALLLAALVALFTDRRRASLVLAACLLLAAGLAHGAFFGFAMAVFGGAFVLRLFVGRGSSPPVTRGVDLRRLVAVCAGSVAVLGGLVVTHRLTVGGSHVFHSGDAILRTLGDRQLLRDQYAQRFPGAVQAAGLYATVPLAVWGMWFARKRGSGSPLVTSVAVAGILATVGGIAAALATGWFPAGRVLGVAVWLPILASIGIFGIASALTSRPGFIRVAIGAVLTLVLLVAPFRSLLGSNVAASPMEISTVRAAGHFAATLPPHTPLVFLIDVHGSNPAFEASRFENVTRMALPPERMADVRLFLGSPAELASGQPSLDGDPVHDALAQLYAKRVAPALLRPHAVFLLQPFGPHVWKTTTTGRLIAPGARVLEAPLRHGNATAIPALGDVSPLGRLGLAIAFILLLGLVGLGWTRALLPGVGSVLGVALAPAVGAGALVLFTVGADAVGIHPAIAAPWVVPVVALAGFAMWKWWGGDKPRPAEIVSLSS
jgi:hypothetical protein